MTAHAAAKTQQLVDVGTLELIAVAELRESPWNPRTHFDPVKLDELAKSLRDQGQLAPLVVRPLTAEKKASAQWNAGRYEIGAGHRRFRAAQQAGLTHLLGLVRELDDTSFFELLVFENGNRHDLHPLEEAQGYKLLMEHAGYDIAKIAARDGRSTKYVYDSVKLLQLTKEAKKLFWAGQIEKGHAILLARLTPEAQARVIGDWQEIGYDYAGGLFEEEGVEVSPHDEDDDADEVHVKPVTVRELQRFINDHVRFQPAEVDLPNLFPETHDLLQSAAAADQKVVYITYEYVVHPDARDGTTIGPRSWERADGQWKSKRCDYSVIGVVATGPERGQAFRVCLNKQQCKVHWPEHVKRAAQVKKRAKAGPAKDGKAATRARDREARDEAARVAKEKAKEAERARWTKAIPQLAAALAAKVKTAPTGPMSVLGALVLDQAPHAYGTSKKVKDLVAPGRTAEDLVRRCAWLALVGDLNSWHVTGVAADFKALGLDAQAIVDQAVPPPKPKVQTSAKTPAKTPRPQKRAKR